MLLTILILFNIGFCNCLTHRYLKQISYNNNFRKIDYKKYFIDIDGTICDNKNSDYINSKPKYDLIKIFNKLYEEGNEVHYWTARGALSGKNWEILTKDQMKKWRVKYTSLNMAKPHYDVWIDDKAINVNDIDKYIN